MKFKLLPRRTHTPGQVPTRSDLENFELAVNVPDKKVWMRFGDKIVELHAVEGMKTEELVDTLATSGIDLSI